MRFERWKGIDVGIPNAPVYDIPFNPSIKRTVVFTFSRLLASDTRAPPS